MKVFQFYAELSKSAESDVREVLSKLPADRTYCVSFEKGSETGKEHWQGWIETTEGCVKNDQQLLRDWYRSKGLSGSTNQWSCAMLKRTDPEHPKNWFSYIIKNPSKVLDVLIHNIKDYDKFRDSLVDYHVTTRKQRRATFAQTVFEKCAADCVDLDRHNKVIIDYRKIPLLIMDEYASAFKVFDGPKLNQFALGASNYLENIYAGQLSEKPQVFDSIKKSLNPLFTKLTDEEKMENYLENMHDKSIL